METTLKDTALRQALAPNEPLKLPSNFAHLTLCRIERERKAHERREHIFAIATVAACLLLGCAVIGYFYGASLLAALQVMARQSESYSLVPGIAFCCIFFALLNHYLRRKYA
ncbi:MAG: hypothetical protein IKR50_08000 [Prevotella sp.]|nr:hypothetical protein [Prevotella sp.]